MTAPKAWHPMDANVEPFEQEYLGEWPTPERPDLTIGGDRAAGPDETVGAIVLADGTAWPNLTKLGHFPRPTPP